MAKSNPIIDQMNLVHLEHNDQLAQVTALLPNLCQIVTNYVDYLNDDLLLVLYNVMYQGRTELQDQRVHAFFNLVYEYIETQVPDHQNRIAVLVWNDAPLKCWLASLATSRRTRFRTSLASAQELMLVHPRPHSDLFELLMIGPLGRLSVAKIRTFIWKLVFKAVENHNVELIQHLVATHGEHLDSLEHLPYSKAWSSTLFTRECLPSWCILLEGVRQLWSTEPQQTAIRMSVIQLCIAHARLTLETCVEYELHFLKVLQLHMPQYVSPLVNAGVDEALINELGYRDDAAARGTWEIILDHLQSTGQCELIRKCRGIAKANRDLDDDQCQCQIANDGDDSTEGDSPNDTDDCGENHGQDNDDNKENFR